MTICIGVLCDSGNTLVFMTDKMLSLGYVSSDSASKGWQVNHRWVALNAGNDISQAESVLRRVGVQLGPYEQEVSAADVEAAFVSVYQDEVRKEAERRVLGCYGLTMARFLVEGLAMFGEHKFTSLCRDIEAVGLGCDFLVCGFDRGPFGDARIFTVVSPGVTREYGRIGYWAIGSGETTALSSLMFHRYTAGTRNSLAFYLVAEAKFMAETAMGVGMQTAMYFMRRGEQAHGIPDSHVEAIRRVWEAEGRPKVPENILETMKKIIDLKPPTAGD